MKLLLLTVGKGSPAWAEAGVDAYAKRLRRVGGLAEKQLKPALFRGDVDAVRAAEGARILAAVKPRDRLVCLDERGEDLDTEAFSVLLREGRTCAGKLVFAIGGPYGHAPEVRARAWRTIRLSKLVLNHQVARLVFVEQLYRATTILDGVPYHH